MFSFFFFANDINTYFITILFFFLFEIFVQNIYVTIVKKNIQLKNHTLESFCAGGFYYFLEIVFKNIVFVIYTL